MRTSIIAVCLFFVTKTVGMFAGFELTNGIHQTDFLSELWATPYVETEPSQGQITITSFEKSTGEPIKDVMYQVRSTSESNVVSFQIVTDETGTAVSPELDYGNYVVRPLKAPVGFAQAPQLQEVTLTEPNQEVSFDYQIDDHIKQFSIEEGNLDISQLMLPVDTLLQNPELPNGCEITSATALLHYWGYEVSKTTMSDFYLPKQPFEWKFGKLFGPDPFVAYAGEPRSASGFYSFSPPIVQAVNDYLNDVEGAHQAVDLSGSSREEILAQLDQGHPVAVWVTLDFSAPRWNYSWYLTDSGEYYKALVNLHVVVLHGYDGNQLQIMNPLKGHMEVDADMFFTNYEQMGYHAMTIVKQ